MSAHFVYLASASPRRRELLTQIGVEFQSLAVSVDESVESGEPPLRYVMRVSRAKADAGWENRPVGASAPVLAADTTVVIGGKVLGKPADAAAGIEMLLELSGRTHEVMTAIVLKTPVGVECRVSRSEVRFRAIERGEATAYWKTGEPRDKAGGYAIQGRGAVFVADLRGSHSGVMGLPLYETAELLDAHGVRRWR